MKSPRLGIEDFSLTVEPVQQHSLNFPQISLDRLTKIVKSQAIFDIHLIFGPLCKEEYTYNSATCYHYLFFNLSEFLVEIKALGLSLSAQEFNSDVFDIVAIT